MPLCLFAGIVSSWGRKPAPGLERVELPSSSSFSLSLCSVDDMVECEVEEEQTKR